ncbi:MAG: general secretion pathway protein GspB [Desulfuromonas sp.]|nr:general secretion pathway protein GspB [Desulfuromonas sp.]
MSFILEALKKSEKNHQENSVPTLDTLHEATEQPRKRPLWPLMMMAVLIVNAAVLLWLFGPWQQTAERVEQPAPVTDNPAVIMAAAQTIAAPTPSKTMTTQTVVAPVKPTIPVVITPAISAPVVSPPVVTAQPAAPQSPAVAVPAIATPQPQAVVSAPTAIESPTQPLEIATPQIPTIAPPVVEAVTQPAALAISELPVNIQNQLPPMHMSVHAYNANANSLIRLNGKIMRQSSFLDGRYRLEEITPDGAIFSYQGYRFLVPRKGR